jgi:hypothetical protein
MNEKRVHSRGKGLRLSSSGRWAEVLSLGLGILLLAQPASGQTGLADYDYENLSFRGFSLETGHIWPTTAESTYTIGTRIDLGYLGPGLRLVPGVSYWSSKMNRSEVRRFERNLDELVERDLEPGSEFNGVNLGTIDWSDFIISMDSHFVWSVPLNLLTYAGAGLSLHFMNGEGEAIAGTFVEDLLDTVKPGFNVHGGLEYPIGDGFRLYGLARYELMENLRYFELRLGGQIMLTDPAPGERRSP